LIWWPLLEIIRKNNDGKETHFLAVSIKIDPYAEFGCFDLIILSFGFFLYAVLVKRKVFALPGLFPTRTAKVYYDQVGQQNGKTA
jgi:hypothetical protein